MSGGRRRRSLRVRLDTSALRWQARLDNPWVDRVVPWALGGLLAIALVAIGLATQRSLDGGPNVAVWTQAAWNLGQGNGPVSSLAGGDVVTQQWAFTSLAVLGLGAVLPAGVVLVVVAAVCLGLAVVPIWRTARAVSRLRLGATTALTLAYCGAPVLYSANLAGWSPVLPAVPAVAWACWFGHQRRWVAYGACVAVALLSRADVGLLLVALGILGISSGERRAGTVTAAVGAVWTTAYLVVVAPTVPRASLTAGEAVLARGTAPLAVLRDPLRLVTDLVTPLNVGALVVLIGPLLFLPLVVPRFALPALPPVVLGLVGDEAVRQASDPVPATDRLPAVLILALVPMVMAATVALARIGQPSVSRIRVDNRVVAALLLATLALFVQSAPASPFNEPWSWGSRDAVDGARLQVADRLDEIDPDLAVTVSPQVAVLVAGRREVREVGLAPPEPGWAPTTPALALDTTAVSADGEPLWDDDDVAEVLARLEDDGFRHEGGGAGVHLLVRDAA